MASPSSTHSLKSSHRERPSRRAPISVGSITTRTANMSSLKTCPVQLPQAPAVEGTPFASGCVAPLPSVSVWPSCSSDGTCPFAAAPLSAAAPSAAGCCAVASACSQPSASAWGDSQPVIGCHHHAEQPLKITYHVIRHHEMLISRTAGHRHHHLAVNRHRRRCAPVSESRRRRRAHSADPAGCRACPQPRARSPCASGSAEQSHSLVSAGPGGVTTAHLRRSSM